MRSINIHKRFRQIRNQAGFTLLELLVVVAILAIVAGGVLVAYDGLEAKSAQGQAAHTLAAIDSGVRTFTTVRKSAPDNLDSLLAGTPGGLSVGYPQTATTVTAPAPVGNLTAGELIEKIIPVPLNSATLPAADATSGAPAGMPAGGLIALQSAGITTPRYVDLAGNGTCTPTCPLAINDETGAAASVGNIALVDIPTRIFDAPSNGNNRGRGFSHPLAAASPVAVWNRGAGGINNLKVGAAADDVLIAFGLGNNASIFKADQAANSDVNLSQAPSYADLKKSDYGRYILLYNLGSIAKPLAKAKLQAVVDSNGDFLDEEIAEFNGQKS